ncbi:hypothetical protein PGT21_022642 [Puccinia graminis f. sp. tritici]|uniref:Uncharacterized protein n=1 Tax=Puccinia graminis f. sp. tritici TaxID=56615 RepID=A0A5B0MRV7_PUCGR|nr:hypothetical protein PGT21_022642 [Puccinia graminis f. sp. tritici]
MREEGRAQSCLKSQANIKPAGSLSRAAGELPRAGSSLAPAPGYEAPTNCATGSIPPLSAEGPDLQPLREHIGKCSTRR